ncbi:MAG TPA: carboxypeptidase-like regulatory domain-containing protein, partial [Myxococcota bacterium]|nr:carboxypeptidase-like regulatory domain-containing protein [Myxococcota bacterium]
LVLGALVRDAQGEAAAHEAVDLLRRSGPVAERLRRAVGPALVQAGATEDRQALIEALMRCQGGEPAVLVAGSGTLILADDQDRSVGGPAGFQLPHADAYTLPTMELRVAVLPSGRGRLEIVAGEGILVVSLPGRGGNILRCYRRISPGTRATLFYDENGAGDLRENGRRILPDMVAVEPDAGPGISTAVLAPDTGYGVGFRNIEVRFTEALDRNTALDRRNYQVAGYTVLRVSMYPPTRAVFLFMDNPVLDGAVLEVKDVRDRRGNPALLQRVPIRGGTYAGEVVGIARDPAGRPLPDARIQVEGDSFYRETRADEAGAFLVPFVPMGRSTVRITDSLRGRQVDVAVELVD